MKIIAWNVQGVKKPQICEEVRYIIHFHRPDMLFLTETMVVESTTLRLISHLGFDHYDFINPANHSGMWVLWNNNNILANVLLKEQRFIHMLVLDIQAQHMVTISSVYAPRKASENRSFGTISLH